MSKKTRKVLLDFVLLVVFPVAAVLGLQLFFLGQTSELGSLAFFVLFLVHWLTFSVPVGIVRYLAKRVGSISKLVGVLMVALAAEVIVNQFGLLVFDKLYIPSGPPLGSIVAGFMFLGFILSVGVLSLLTTLVVAIKQGSNNALYSSQTEYALYGLVVFVTALVASF